MANYRKRSRKVGSGKKVQRFRRQVRKAKKSKGAKSPGVRKQLKRIEEEILTPEVVTEVVDAPVEKKERKAAYRDMLEQIMFKLPYVIDPLIGTPKQVQKELDTLVKKMQKDITNDATFDRIHLYMHGYLINVVLKKFPYIVGYQTVDVYQETLIALRFKAIPRFKKGKGMSFLNFAKMCIRRHLITILNAAKNRKRDQSMNTAISLDSSPIKDDNGEHSSLMNIIADESASVDKVMENSEAYRITVKTLLTSLSTFERVVLEEYLSNSSYQDISKNIKTKTKKRCNTKSIDNALLRIRKKAIYLKKHCKVEDIPVFMKTGKTQKDVAE